MFRERVVVPLDDLFDELRMGTEDLGAVLSVPFWPHSQPYGIAVTALIAIAAQLVSPWSETAANYARYQKKHKIA